MQNKKGRTITFRVDDEVATGLGKGKNGLITQTPTKSIEIYMDWGRYDLKRNQRKKPANIRSITKERLFNQWQ